MSPFILRQWGCGRRSSKEHCFSNFRLRLSRPFIEKRAWMMRPISKVASLCHCSNIDFFAEATMLFGTLHILKLDNLDQMPRGFKTSKLLRHPPMTFESVYSMSVYIVRRTNLKELQCIRLQKWESLLQSPSLTWMGDLHPLKQQADIQSPRSQADTDFNNVRFDKKHEAIGEAILQHCSTRNYFELGTQQTMMARRMWDARLSRPLWKDRNVCKLMRKANKHLKQKLAPKTSSLSICERFHDDPQLVYIWFTGKERLASLNLYQHTACSMSFQFYIYCKILHLLQIELYPTNQ